MKSQVKRRRFLGCLTLLSLLLWTGPLWSQELRYPFIKEPIPTPVETKIVLLAARLNDDGVSAIRQVSRFLGWHQEQLGQAVVAARRFRPGTKQYGIAQERLGLAIMEDALARLWARGVIEEALARLILVSEIEPGFVLVHYNCAIAFLARNGPEDEKSAVHHLEMGLALDPDNRMLRAFHEEIVGKG